jgi:hypothetical protein
MQEFRASAATAPQDAVQRQKKGEFLVVFLMANAVVSGRKL